MVKKTIHIGLRELTLKEKTRLGISTGIKVSGYVNPRLWRWNENIIEGFIILAVNGICVRSLQEFHQLLISEEELNIEGIWPDGTHDHYYIA